MAGRKTDCTPELTQQIADLIAEGLSNKDACALVGITERTFYNWTKQGEEDIAEDADTPFIHFFQSIKEAEPKFIQKNIDIIQRAAEKSWQAAAWLLERKYPQQYALVRRTELTGAGGRPLTVEYVNDWRNQASISPSRPTDGKATDEALQLAVSGAALAEDNIEDGPLN